MTDYDHHHNSSACLQIGTGQPFTLHGSPRVRTRGLSGAVAIELGITSDGRPVTITVGSLEHLIDLESAVREAFCQGIVETDMQLVTP